MKKLWTSNRELLIFILVVLAFVTIVLLLEELISSSFRPISIPNDLPY